MRKCDERGRCLRTERRPHDLPLEIQRELGRLIRVAYVALSVMVFAIYMVRANQPQNSLVYGIGDTPRDQSWVIACCLMHEKRPHTRPLQSCRLSSEITMWLWARNDRLFTRYPVRHSIDLSLDINWPFNHHHVGILCINYLDVRGAP